MNTYIYIYVIYTYIHIYTYIYTYIFIYFYIYTIYTYINMQFDMIAPAIYIYPKNLPAFKCLHLLSSDFLFRRSLLLINLIIDSFSLRYN